jgi:hypothetical protein
MQNARKYTDRITIGAVPSQEDLEQLKELGYATLIDLRDEQERFGGAVAKAAESLGLHYLALPITREGDLTLRSFIVDAINSGELAPIVRELAGRFPGLARCPAPTPEPEDSRDREEDIQTALSEALRLWTSTRDRAALSSTLRQLIRKLEAQLR